MIVKIPRLRNRNGGEAAESHELLAVPGDDENLPAGLCLSQAKAHQGRAAHRAPEIVVVVAIAGGVDVIGRRAQAGDDQQIVAMAKQRGNRVAARKSAGLRAFGMRHGHHHFFFPSKR